MVLSENEHSLEAVTTSRERIAAETAMIATGAWMPEVAAKWRLRLGIRAGRGRLFKADGANLPEGPYVFLCTPYQGALRITVTMEFLGPDEPIKATRVRSLCRAVAPLLNGIDWESHRDIWVGSGPRHSGWIVHCRQTEVPENLCSRGHGTWGVVLAPATGRFRTQQIILDATPAAISPFDPLRP